MTKLLCDKNKQPSLYIADVKFNVIDKKNKITGRLLLEKIPILLTSEGKIPIINKQNFEYDLIKYSGIKDSSNISIIDIFNIKFSSELRYDFYTKENFKINNNNTNNNITMDNEIIKVAKDYINRGFSVIPVNSAKEPTIPNWTIYQTRQMTIEEVETNFKNAKNIAVLCGGASRLFCLDVDSKYDLSGTLFNDLKRKTPNSILKKLYCQKTKNNGYHLVCIVPSSKLNGNEKLAMRHTTTQEKHITYLEEYQDPKTRDNALKTAINDKYRVLLETRSGSPEKSGGYFLVPPSEGYEYIYGEFKEINEDEYDILIETARSFNEVIVKKIEFKTFESTQWIKSPFDHFNESGDVISLLENNGWKIYSDKGRYWKLKRPGKTSTKYSANFDTETRIFNVFSTSTSFDIGKGYSPTGVFIHLECNDNEKEAYSKLLELGWGISNV